MHHTQPDASCEAETSFLSCFAFDDSELTCSTTTSRPCSFPFDSLRALASSFSLHLISFISLFLISPPIALHFFFCITLMFFSFGLICNFILKCILHHASIKLNFFFVYFLLSLRPLRSRYHLTVTSPSFLPRQIFKFLSYINTHYKKCEKTILLLIKIYIPKNVKSQ